jgi:hypothetical protein
MGRFPFSQFPFSPILEQRIIADLEESPKVARLPAAQRFGRFSFERGKGECACFPSFPFP